LLSGATFARLLDEWVQKDGQLSPESNAAVVEVRPPLIIVPSCSCRRRLDGDAAPLRDGGRALDGGGASCFDHLR
jgi:hypothetical protein